MPLVSWEREKKPSQVISMNDFRLMHTVLCFPHINKQRTIWTHGQRNVEKFYCYASKNTEHSAGCEVIMGRQLLRSVSKQGSQDYHR
jgi:hypothetical protein